MADKAKAKTAAKAEATETVESNTGPEMLKKISARNVMGGKVEKPTKATDLYTVFGLANGLKTGQSDYGEWTALLGTFKAIRAHDGKVFFGAKCFLPSPADEMIQDALSAAREHDANAAVEFAYIIGVKPADTATGYEYTVRPVIEQKADALAALESRIAGKVPALAAPTK